MKTRTATVSEKLLIGSKKPSEFLASGYAMNTKAVLNDALFEVKYDEMVIVANIDFFSMCEHHLLPFFDKCHVAYIPDQKVVGLSKIARLVEVFSRRLQVQEAHDPSTVAGTGYRLLQPGTAPVKSP